MSRIFMYAFLVCQLLGLHFMAKAELEIDEGKNGLRVMTFNIRYAAANDRENSWDLRKAAIRSFLQGQNADVMGFQEAMLHQVDYLATSLPNHQFVSRGRRPDPKEDEACPIFFNPQKLQPLESGTFWLSDTPSVPGSHDWGNRIPRIVTWAKFSHLPTNETVLVMNTHFDYNINSFQLKSSLLMTDFIRRQNIARVMIMGDFNITDEHPAIPALRDNVFVPLLDSWRFLNPNLNMGTWHDWSGRTDRERIDFIFTSKDTLEPTQSTIFAEKVEGRWMSDHHVVISEVAVLK